MKLCGELLAVPGARLLTQHRGRSASSCPTPPTPASPPQYQARCHYFPLVYLTLHYEFSGV